MSRQHALRCPHVLEIQGLEIESVQPLDDALHASLSEQKTGDLVKRYDLETFKASGVVNTDSIQKMV